MKMKGKLIYFVALAHKGEYGLFKGYVDEDYDLWLEVSNIECLEGSDGCSHRVDTNYVYVQLTDAKEKYIELTNPREVKLKKVYEWIFRNSPRLGWRVSDRLLTENEAKEYFEENVLLGGMFKKKSEIGIIVEE